MRFSPLFAVSTLVFVCQACSDSPSYSEELAAVEQLVTRYESALRAAEADPELSFEQAAIELDCLQGWEDPSPKGSMEQGFEYRNETLVLISALIEWQQMTGDSAGWRIVSSSRGESGQVIVTLPYGQQLELEVMKTELGWRIMRLDPIFEAELVRTRSEREFVESVLARMFEIESSLLAHGVKLRSDRSMYMMYSGKCHERLFLSTWNDRSRREYEARDRKFGALSVPVQHFLSAQHDAWEEGRDAQLRIHPTESTEDSQALVRVDLANSKNPARFGQFESIQFVLEKDSGNWTLIRLEDHAGDPAFFEFRNDGKGNWNYQAPKSD
jgi:hypothetical protein